MSEIKPTNTTNWTEMNQNQVQNLFLNETVTCAKDVYERSLVQTGQAKDINEAKKMETVPCSCPKCNIKFL